MPHTGDPLVDERLDLIRALATGLEMLEKGPDRACRNARSPGTPRPRYRRCRGERAESGRAPAPAGCAGEGGHHRSIAFLPQSFHARVAASRSLTGICSGAVDQSGRATGAILSAPIASGGPYRQIEVRRSRPVLLVSIHRRHTLVRRHRLGRAHNLLLPVLTRKTGSSDGILPIHWSGTPTDARCGASCGRGVCRLRFRPSPMPRSGRRRRQRLLAGGFIAGTDQQDALTRIVPSCSPSLL
jgi:hypothetical protein